MMKKFIVLITIVLITIALVLSFLFVLRNNEKNKINEKDMLKIYISGKRTR
jgi:uncharacterized protein involved in outer membrane biogenesis